MEPKSTLTQKMFSWVYTHDFLIHYNACSHCTKHAVEVVPLTILNEYFNLFAFLMSSEFLIIGLLSFSLIFIIILSCRHLC